MGASGVGNGLGIPSKNYHFWVILLYFRSSGVSPIYPARRELQTAIREIEIGDFLIFDVCSWNGHKTGAAVDINYQLSTDPVISVISVY